MSVKKTLVEVVHDEGYSDNLLLHINNAFLGKDMTAEKVVKQHSTSVAIEGIPEGWEPVRVGTPNIGESYIGRDGRVCKCEREPGGSGWVIVRKIEKPKQYRPFANAAEAEPFWDAKLRFRDTTDSRFRVVGIGAAGCQIGNEIYPYKDAFDRFECVDGTPFGIEVQ